MKKLILVLFIFVSIEGFSTISWMGNHSANQSSSSQDVTFYVEMYDNYDGCHAEVGIYYNDSWNLHTMSYQGPSGNNSTWSVTFTVPSGSHNYYYHGWDDWGANVWDNNGGSNYTINVIAATTTTDGNWNTGSTWSWGVVPTSDDIVINNNVNLDIDVSISSLTINSGKSLTINQGKGLTVSGTLTNSAGESGLVIYSDATGSGSLITDQAVSVTCQRYIPQFSKGTTGMHFLSSPVAAQNISTEFFNVATPVPTGVDFFYFNEEHNYWINIKNGTAYNQGATWEHFSNDANPSFTVGKGYLVGYNTNVTKDFAGTLNTGNKTPTITYTSGEGDGWNLIGNPYPSAIDWDEETWSRTNVDGTVYVYDGTAGQYISWNGTTGGLDGGIIPAMQGFLVKANAASPSITIPTASRVHSSQAYYKSSETIKDLLVLNAAGNDYEDNIYINFNENASIGFDNEFDAYKRFGTEEAPQFYSIIPDDILSINVLPYSDEEVLIPLGLEVGTEGEYVISVKENTFIETVQIYFEDLENGEKTELKTSTSYAFTSHPDDDPERFMLHFFGVSGIENSYQTNERQFYVYNNTINIISEELQSGTIQVFDMLGQKVMEKEYSGHDNSINLNLLPAIYIVRIISGENIVSGKIHID
ncbi:MAG: T9SS type A sorting domain-containing protein [Bacteroidales bacterium]|nr:T9SS type A sorting domain-containing protein [Bacteroidales bacterium]